MRNIRGGKCDWCRWGWNVFLGAELALLVYYLAYFTIFQDSVKMEQEAHYPEVVENFVLPAADILDTVSFFSGSEEMGIDLTATAKRCNLSFLSGQMMWFVMDDSVAPRSQFMRQVEKVISGPELAQRFQPCLSNGVLNFLFDISGYSQGALHNWSSTAVTELQGTPFLPWEKSLDFVALSSLHPDSAGGLRFITDLNQKMLFITPPLNEAEFKKLGGFTDKPNLLVLPEGMHRLTPKMSALVYATGRRDYPYELSLLSEREDGTLAVFVGTGLCEPFKVLQIAYRECGRKPSLYVGSTPWNYAFDTEKLYPKLRVIQENYPSLKMVLNGQTSHTVLATLEALSGGPALPEEKWRYRSGCLGKLLHFRETM